MNDQDTPNETKSMSNLQRLEAMSSPLPANYEIENSFMFEPSRLPETNGQPALKLLTENSMHHSYQHALNTYQTETHVPDISCPALLNPLAFFYCRKGRIYSFFPFPYHNGKTFVLSQRTFPSFLRCCNLPDNPAEARTALFEALKEYVTNYPLNEQEKLLQVLVSKDINYTDYLSRFVKVSSERNLYFKCSATPDFAFSSTSILAPQFYTSPQVPRNILKQYFSSIINHPKEDQTLAPSFLLPKCVVFYSEFPDPKFQPLIYDSSFEISYIPAPQLPMKALPYLDPPATVPSDAASQLFHLTGGSIELVDELAQLLARAANPTPTRRNMTVVCSRENPDILLDVLQKTLSSLVISEASISSNRTASSLPSLNQLCRKTSVHKLFLAQSIGKGVVFVRDHEVSDTARPVLNKLLSGKRIPISTKHFPTQHFYNKIHFICISHDPKRAAGLSNSLKVPLIDLSSNEIPLCNPAQLSCKDINWLHSVFLPYGLVSNKSIEKIEKTPTPSDWVREFLTLHCSVQPGVKCHRNELYAAYDAFYRHTHPGLKPPLSPGQLVKAVKPYLGKGNLRMVSYRKIRSDQKMYFVGLSCPTSLPDPAPIPKNPHTASFTAHLEEIHSMCPNFKLVPKILVSITRASMTESVDK